MYPHHSLTIHQDCRQAFGTSLDPCEAPDPQLGTPQAYAFCDGTSQRGRASRGAWGARAAGCEPYFPPKSHNVLTGKARDPFRKQVSCIASL